MSKHRKADDLTAYRYNEAIWVVWCAFCNKWHQHSAGEGHRVAHCHHHEGSPYHPHGYNLIDGGVPPAWLRRDIHRKKPKGPYRAEP